MKESQHNKVTQKNNHGQAATHHPLNEPVHPTSGSEMEIE